MADDDRERRRRHEGTDGIESDQDRAPEGTKPEDYKNVPGNQT